MHNKFFSAIILATTLSVASIPALAGVVVYTTTSVPNGTYTSNTNAFNAWLSALSGETTNSAPIGSFDYGASYTSVFDSAGDSIGISGNPSIFGSFGGMFGSNFFLDGNGLVQFAAASSENLYAIGFYLGCTNSSCANIQPYGLSATDATGTTTVLASISNGYYWPTSTPQFIGLVSTSPLTQVVLSGNVPGMQPQIAISEITVGTNETPEAATLILIGAGLGLMARYRRFTIARPF